MFRRLNKSAIWLLCQFANHWLWNLSKWPFTGAVLQSTSPSNPSACPSSMGGPGYAGGWSVGWWYQISHAIQARRFIHFGDVHSKQWAALIASSLSAYIVWSFGQVIDLNYYVCYSSSASGNLPRVVLFVNNHKTETDHEPRFLLKNLPKPAANTKMETVTALDAWVIVTDSGTYLLTNLRQPYLSYSCWRCFYLAVGQKRSMKPCPL